MLIDINELRERSEPLRVELKFSEQQLDLRNTVSTLEAPMHSDVRVALSGERLRVWGNLEAELQVTCSRCLKKFPSSIYKGFDLEYWPDPQVEGEGEEFALTYTELDIGFYRNDQIDLSVVISEQIVLEIPMKPVCQDDCRGLCDQCGADLNEGQCNCDRRRMDPRLSVLSDLKKRMTN